MRINVFHLPIHGGGDGGIFTTAADMSRFRQTLFAGKIVSPQWVAEMIRPRSDVPSEGMRCGLGFWLHPTGCTNVCSTSQPSQSTFATCGWISRFSLTLDNHSGA